MRSSAAGAPGSRRAASTGALVARPLRQGQRPALAVADGRRPDPLGRPALGVAVVHGAGTVRALQRRSWPTLQEADRLGASGDSAGQTLAGEAPGDHCRRLWLRRTRSDRGGAAACLSGHTVAPRCRSVRAGTGAATEAARPATSQRRALAEARRGAGRSREASGRRSRCRRGPAANSGRSRSFPGWRCGIAAACRPRRSAGC